MADKFDVVIIGGGTAGLVTASGCARLGRRVAIIEKEKLGGDCLWTGCVPTKALVASARLIHHMHDAKAWGIDAVEPRFTTQAIMDAMRATQRIAGKNDDPEKFRSLGSEVSHGEARPTSESDVDVAGRNCIPGDRV